MRNWLEGRRWIVLLAIGALSAWLWIRVGLYGFGLPVGIAVVVPILYLAWHYLRSTRSLDAGVLIGSFAAVWAGFEALTWLNAASDPAVVIPGWSPVPLATAVALVILGITLAVSRVSHE